MTNVTLHHFERAALDIGAHGDNDTLPFDVDNKFIKECCTDLSKIAYAYFSELDSNSPKNVASRVNSLEIFSERLLVPTGSTGFRITTKIHPFWNIYFNGLGVAIAERLEEKRSDRVHSYRYASSGDSLFVREKSWRSYREATLLDPALNNEGAIVVQTDISSFYEHIYHHRLENFVQELFPDNDTVAVQIDRLLNKFSSGRSFGLPVGGQCARILAELLMNAIDQMLGDSGVVYYRYVDDFTLITNSQEDAYKALSVLSHALADYGLSLNRTKTTMLSAKHYKDYVETQIGTSDEEGRTLREIDLHFDPYSDSPNSNYDQLKDTVQKLDVQALLNLELKKGQPDTFLVAQISRTLKFHSPLIAEQLCRTLLNPENLHAFRASWSTIMRGVATVRGEEENSQIFDVLDSLLDEIPVNSSHLLLPEASCLHYLRTIRFERTDKRAQYVLGLFGRTRSETIKRACIDCWRQWNDRPNFIKVRNEWSSLGKQPQRMLWLAANRFGDEGEHFKKQIKRSLPNAWALGIEQRNKPTFEQTFTAWAEDVVQ